jgi:hypothetical protein
MFLYALLCLIFVILQFGLSRSLLKLVFQSSYFLFRSKKVSVQILSLIFLPGTIIHELSHFITAIFMGVHTGRINVIPKIRDDQLIAGETQIAKCDPIRYSIIGIAPFIVGVAIIYSISKIILFPTVNFENRYIPGIDYWQPILSMRLLGLVLLGLILFWVSNTMFSSKKDLQAIIFPLILIYVIGFVLFFAGFKISSLTDILSQFTVFFKELSFFLLVVLGLNSLFWLFIKLWIKLLLLAKRT